MIIASADKIATGLVDSVVDDVAARKQLHAILKRALGVTKCLHDTRALAVQPHLR